MAEKPKFVSLANVDPVTTMAGTDYVYCLVGGSTKKIKLEDLRQMMEQNQQQFLDENAFWIEENVASSKGAAYVNTGGNELVKLTWLSKIKGVLMDTNGNYTPLNPNNSNYTEDGDQVVKDGAVLAAYDKADWMGIVEGGYWNYLQTIEISGVTHIRHHISLIPLPGGWYTEELPVGMFKCYIKDNKLRSIPFVQPAGSKTINAFFDLAQARGKNFGLAGDPFRMFLNDYIYAKYGNRDVQNLKAADGTKIFGCGLDGTETTTQTDGWQKFLRQCTIKTGACLALGRNDGNVEVTDSDGNICHSVNVSVFENAYGQFWEMDGHVCSLDKAADTFTWKGNWLPSGTPTADTFANIPVIKVSRPTSDRSFNCDIALITDKGKQYAAFIPTQDHTGISTGDNFCYGSGGQLWLRGGNSADGSGCGLACSDSNCAWSNSYADFSARLDYHGGIKKVTSAELKALLAAA